ncbi:flagellar assembly protein FliH [Bacillus tuaregi]|uniref:flagellar assembly protein FliH n=1 Tax=Bacillus tuaregi TaxID=1816695 RepID=UPI001356369F|nr:flagellar assembly protein FliH [Bacillus tuaregi]
MSRLIKSQWPERAADKKVISIKSFNLPEVNEDFSAKAESVTRASEQVMEEALHEADRIKDEAKLASEALLAQVQKEREAWEVERDLLTNQAREEGYRAGWEQGQADGYSACQEKLHHAEQIVSSAKKEYHAYLDASEQTILALAVSVAEKIVNKEIKGNQDYFVSLVKKAIREVKEFQDVEIHVHPMNYEYLISKKDELQAIFPHRTNLIIYPDSDLAEGSCLLESPYGRIDAGVDTQLLEIKRKLAELLESDGHESL